VDERLIADLIAAGKAVLAALSEKHEGVDR
jgi:hypothetical protein